jgi:sortase A
MGHMKVTIQHRPSNNFAGRKLLRSAELFLWLVGLLALTYTGSVYLQSYLYQVDESSKFQQERIAGGLRAIPPASPLLAVTKGSPIGLIEVPRVSISTVVVEGVDFRSLQRAEGHIPGTAFPGNPGNVGIAGHRDTFFRELRHLKVHDTIRLTTLKGTFDYSVEWTKVVSPRQTDVLLPEDESTLTLVTCYPFYYVGPSPERFIVRARQIPGPSAVIDR